MADYDFLSIHRNLRRSIALLVGSLADEMGLSAKQIQIFYLLSQKNEVSPSEISEFTAADPAATTRSIAALKKDGFLIQKPDLTDSRKTIVTLTEKGMQRAKIANAVRKKLLAQIEKSLSKEELSQVVKLLEKITENLQNKTGEL